MKYVRNSIMHFITREIRKENQLCRAMEKNLLEPTDTYNPIDFCVCEDYKIGYALDRVKTLVAKNFDEQEKTCLGYIMEQLPFNDIYKNMKEKYIKCSRNEVKKLKEVVMDKVRFEILKYV